MTRDLVFRPRSFGDTLTAAMAKRGLTQRQLAAAAKVSRSTVCRWLLLERATGGRTGVTPRHLAFLKDYFGADLVGPASAAPDAVTLGFWLERARQTEAQLAAALAAHRQFIVDLEAAIASPSAER